jgi:hypothetical protein
MTIVNGGYAKVNMQVVKVGMRTPEGGSVCSLQFVPTKREALARAKRELPGCSIVLEWTKTEDQMSDDESNQCREELGLRAIRPSIPQRRVDLTQLDIARD